MFEGYFTGLLNYIVTKHHRQGRGSSGSSLTEIFAVITTR